MYICKLPVPISKELPATAISFKCNVFTYYKYLSWFSYFDRLSPFPDRAGLALLLLDPLSESEPESVSKIMHFKTSYIREID